MNKYLNIPTHQKYGWLVFLLGFIITGLASLIIPLPELLFGAIQWVFAIAFIIEIIAIISGKKGL